MVGKLADIGVMDSEPDIRNKISRANYSGVSGPMSDSNRGIRPSVKLIGLFATLVMAASGLVGGILYGVYQQAIYEQIAQGRIADYAKHARDRIVDPCSVVAAREKQNCIDQAQSGYELARRDNERNEYDLVAQRRSALWTTIMGIAALLGVALSAVGVWLVWTTFRETRRQAQIAQDNLDAYREAERGHIEIRIAGGNKSETSDVISYEVQLHNVGRSAVKILSLQYDALRKPEPKDIYRGATFEEFMIAAGESTNPSPLIKAGAHIEKYPYLGGHVSYRCKFGQMHRTHFCYKVAKLQSTPEFAYLTRFTHSVHECRRERDWPSDI